LIAAGPASGQMAVPAAPDFGAVQGPSNAAILRCNGGDPAAAVAGCTAIIQSSQSRAQMRSAAFVNRGRAYYALGEKDRALGDFEAGVRADPKSSRALANRGAFYQAQGDLNRAAEDYTSAIAVNPRDIEAFNQRANVHMLNGDSDNAGADYDHAIALHVSPQAIPAAARPIASPGSSTGRCSTLNARSVWSRGLRLRSTSVVLRGRISATTRVPLQISIGRLPSIPRQ
jgi:tetratricopeptide (TPR) repeat protein